MTIRTANDGSTILQVNGVDKLTVREDGAVEAEYFKTPGGVLRGIASTAQAQALTDDEHALTPAKLGEAMNARVLGMGQTWQNVTAQRAINTTYTNTTGRPIFVSASVVIPPGGGHVRLSIQGMEVAGYDSGTDFGWDSRPYFTVCGLVPSGSSYSVLSNSSDIFYWRELR